MKKGAVPGRDADPMAGAVGSMRRREAGVVFIWVLVGLFVMAIMLMAAVQPASVIMQREREAELRFNGRAYVEAIREYQQEHGGAFPTKLEDLMKEGPKQHRYIRQLYPNPFAPDGKWGLLAPGATVVTVDKDGKVHYESQGGPPTAGVPGSPGGMVGAAGAQPTMPGQTGQIPTGNQTGQLGQPGEAGSGETSAQPTQILPFRLDGKEGEPILGVWCNDHKKAFRPFLGKDYYDQWFFSPLVVPPPLPVGIQGVQTQPPGGTTAPKPG